MAKVRIVSMGRCITEMYMQIPEIPPKNHSLQFDGSCVFRPGGRGAVLALAAALSGAESFLCTRTGDDYYAEKLLRLLRENGVNTRFISQDKREQTGMTLVLAEKDGSERRIVFSGAGALFSPDDIETAFLSLPDGISVTSEMPEKLLRYTLLLAEQKEIPVFFLADGKDDSLSFPGMKTMHAFVTDSNTASFLTGISSNSQSSCMRCVIALSELVSAKHYIVKLPGGGYYLYDGKYSEMIEPYGEDANSGTYGKEVFLGALASKVLSSENFLHGAKFAAAAEALASSGGGGIDSVPEESAVLNLIKQKEGQ